MIPTTEHIQLARRKARKGTRVWRSFRGKKVGVAAAIALFLLILFCWVGPLLGLQDPNSQDLYNRAQPPSPEHWLGTDAYGRDVLARLMFAGQTSLIAAAQATGIAALIGVPLGALAGYVGGWSDAILSRVTDALMALPGLILVFAVIGVIGPGLTNAMLALGILLSTEFFRVTRAATLTARGQLYVLAARAVGVRPSRLLGRHILVNIASPLMVQASFCVGMVIMAEASLSFIGVGVQLPQASWGSMVREGFDQIYSYPLMMLPATLAIIFTVLCFSLVGDALRDALGRDTVRN